MDYIYISCDVSHDTVKTYIPLLLVVQSSREPHFNWVGVYIGCGYIYVEVYPVDHDDLLRRGWN